jgi:hypothetical protein
VGGEVDGLPDPEDGASAVPPVGTNLSGLSLRWTSNRKSAPIALENSATGRANLCVSRRCVAIRKRSWNGLTSRVARARSPSPSKPTSGQHNPGDCGRGRGEGERTACRGDEPIWFVPPLDLQPKTTADWARKQRPGEGEPLCEPPLRSHPKTLVEWAHLPRHGSAAARPGQIFKFVPRRRGPPCPPRGTGLSTCLRCVPIPQTNVARDQNTAAREGEAPSEPRWALLGRPPRPGTK